MCVRVSVGRIRTAVAGGGGLIASSFFVRFSKKHPSPLLPSSHHHQPGSFPILLSSYLSKCKGTRRRKLEIILFYNNFTAIFMHTVLYSEKLVPLTDTVR